MKHKNQKLIHLGFFSTYVGKTMSPTCQRWQGKLVRNLLVDISGIWQYRMCVPRWRTAPKVFCNGLCFLVSMPVKSSPLEGEWDLWPVEYGKGDEMSHPQLCYITLDGWLVVNSCSCSPTGFIEASKHCLVLSWNFFELISYVGYSPSSSLKTIHYSKWIHYSLFSHPFCKAYSVFIDLHILLFVDSSHYIFFSFKCLASWIMPSLYIYYLFLAHSRHSTHLLVFSYQDFSVTTGKCTNTDS